MIQTFNEYQKEAVRLSISLNKFIELHPDTPEDVLQMLAVAYDGTMIPDTGKEKYVSVYRKGDIIQIKHESGYDDLEFDEIRIIPYQLNHGVMVGRWKDGEMRDRRHLDIEQFNKNIIFASNVEALASKKEK